MSSMVASSPFSRRAIPARSTPDGGDAGYSQPMSSRPLVRPQLNGNRYLFIVTGFKFLEHIRCHIIVLIRALCQPHCDWVPRDIPCFIIIRKALTAYIHSATRITVAHRKGAQESGCEDSPYAGRPEPGRSMAENFAGFRHSRKG